MSAVADFEASFLAFPDECAVLDTDGRIVAVNEAWTSFAPAGSASGKTGVGADYLAVCRRAATQDPARARDAYRALTDVMLRRRATASVSYPCTLPSGVRWFRGDVFALGSSGLIGTRHVDITADLSDARGHLATDLLVDAPRVMTEAALELALQDAFDGPPDPAVLVLVTDLAPSRAEVRWTGDVDVVRAAVVDQIRASDVGVDVIAALGTNVLAVLVTAADHLAAMERAGTVIDVASRVLTSPSAQWGIATRTSSDTAATVLARARRTLTDAVVRDTVQADHLRAADRSERLFRAAEGLVAAVTAFDLALDRGVAMTELARFDRAVLLAERACVAAAVDYRTT